MAKLTASDRARRLIALLGRMQIRTPFSISALATEMNTTPAELSRDLMTLSYCGIAPYSPDVLVPLSIEGDVVIITGSVPALRGPVRLSPDEAEALAAALAAAGFSGTDPLATKLLAAASAAFDAEELERTLRTGTSAHDSGVFESLAAGIRAHSVLRIAYLREGAPTTSIRTVEPLQLFADRGAWYLSAWCRDAGGYRTFRVDRIRSSTATDECFEAADRAEAHLATDAFSGEGLPRARVRFSSSEAFVEREWPGGRIVETDEQGSIIAEVPYGGTDWIARHVVARLGEVEVLSPAEVRAAVLALALEELAAR